jgi:DNA-binding NtrC family response regulator
MMDMAETALVVDDDFLMRGYAVERLKQEGVFVIETSAGEEFHRLQANRKFDLVFADLDLFLAADGVFNNVSGTIYVVMTSFRNVDKAIQLVNNGGVYDYLMKPFSPEQVSVIISRTRELLKLRAQIELLEKKTARGNFDLQSGAGSQVSSVSGSITNLQDLERQTIIRVLHETRGSRSVTAERLGISVRTLRNKLTQYKQEASLQLP